MESDTVPETVVSTDLTLQDVLSAGGGELNHRQFGVLAKAAMDEAAETSGDAQAKFEVFWRKLVEYCQLFGDPIPRRFTLVAYPTLRGYDKWEFGGAGQRLEFFQTGIDNFRYVARVYP